MLGFFSIIISKHCQFFLRRTQYHKPLKVGKILPDNCLIPLNWRKFQFRHKKISQYPYNRYIHLYYSLYANLSTFDIAQLTIPLLFDESITLSGSLFIAQAVFDIR